MSRQVAFRRALFASAALIPSFAVTAFAQELVLPPPENGEAPDAAATAESDGGVIVLDRITVVPTKTAEPVATTLAAVTQVDRAELQQLQPTQASDIFFGMPGVMAQADSRRSQTSMNIRGLQDFGRVAVIVDGARNNFQRSDHGTQSVFWVEPELLKEVTVVRGPVSNIYGSGAIGGVVVFETIDAFDYLYDGERMAGSFTGRFETNGPGFTTSATAAARIGDAFGVIGNVTYKNLDDYKNGRGDTEPGTATEVLGGMLTATLRPDENQELRLGWIGRHDEWTERSGAGRDTELDQNTFTGKYEYRNPDNPWIDFHISGFVNDVRQEQVQLGDETQFDDQTGNPVVIPAGSTRSFDLTTYGVDVWNTSRFDTGPFFHTVTYGGDWFLDEVETTDDDGGGDVYTPSGERQAYGAFIQDQIALGNWLEVIGGLRFDGYNLDGTANGDDVQADGTKLSPRLTVGVSPFEQTALQGLQVYGTYAEGYRSPAVTETLISGMHPAGVTFPFLPNPELQPETATTYEIGLNFNRDDLFIQGDGLRVKTAIFRNDVEDYIGLDEVTPGIFGGDPNCPYVGPFPPTGFPFVPACYQYVNIAEVRIQGFEFESFYDAGRFFTGFNVTLLDGEDRTTGEPLLTVPPATIMGRLGFRFLDHRLVVGGEALHVFDHDEIPASLGEDYTLVNLFAGYQATENFRLDLRLNNIFDERYANFLNAAGGESVLEPGFNAKIGATIRFGAT